MKRSQKSIKAFFSQSAKRQAHNPTAPEDDPDDPKPDGDLPGSAANATEPQPQADATPPLTANVFDATDIGYAVRLRKAGMLT